MADDWSEEEQNVYKEDTREKMVENDEISAEEEGFMMGYEEAEKETEEDSDEEEK